ATRFVVNFSQIDLVFVGYIGQPDMLALGPLVRLLRRPIIFNPLITLTDTLVDDRRTFGAQSLIARSIRIVDALALRLANTVLVDTAENGTYLTTMFGVNPKRIFVVPVGADQELFKHDVEEFSDPAPPGIAVLFYGTMIPLQGVDTIIRAAKLLESDAGTRIEIIGDGQTLSSTRALAQALDVKNVTFTPTVPFSELPCRIRRADIVLGIFGETAKAERVVPNKVYQAMAMGAAVVTRDSSAAGAVLTDGVSALLVPPANPMALSAAIRRLYDRDLRGRLGFAAYERFCETASLDVQAAALNGTVSATMERAGRQRTSRATAR
ncbi:MAG TPA: glycosyltransferase, partial [Gemmatimonadaceae bacterium]|nr:glycosyltransferase [Gemmatimonadaceae bacterium]